MLLNIKSFISSINYSWLTFKLQTQIVFATTILVLSFVISFPPGSLGTVPNSFNLFNISNNRFANDINFLLRDNILTLIEEGKEIEIVPFCERFYRNSSILRYIIFIGKSGVEVGIPYTFQEILAASNSLSFLSYLTKRSHTALNIIILQNETFFGLLLVGTNTSFRPFNNTILTNELLIFLIGSIGITIILVAIFVKLTLKRTLNELSQGLLSIAAGNFSRRINLRFGSEFVELISSFNELGRRLQLYEERKRQQLLSEKVKLESVITTIPDGALLLDTNLRVVLINTTAIKLFGWKTKTRLIGTPIWDHLPIVLQKKLFVTLQDVLFDAQTAIFDGKIEPGVSQVSQRSIRILVNVVYDSVEVNKIPIGIGIIIQDMTKKVELDKTQNRFLSNISHELRTPLFNIKSFIETIQEYDYTLSNWQKRYFLDIVNKETNRLTRLVNDILSISKLDSLKGLPTDTFNLVETVNQTIANYQIVARDKVLYLHSSSSFTTLNIRGNRDLLFQVLINLVGNALKFTYQDGEVIIRSYPMYTNTLRVEIVDTGIGIIYGYQQDIFQRFYRIENEVHTLKGTGLGLSIVETILSEHKTDINVVSRCSVGSAFWFDLLLTKE